MPQELNATDRFVRHERAVLRVAAVVVVVATITLIRTSLTFDSFFKGFIQGAAGVLALIAVSLAIPAVRRHLIPIDALRRHRHTGYRREAIIGLATVTGGLVISLTALQQVPGMSGIVGAMLILFALAVIGLGIIVLAVVPVEQGVGTVEDESMWLPSRDGDV